MGLFVFLKKNKTSKEEQERVMKNARKLLEDLTGKKIKQDSFTDDVSLTINRGSSVTIEYESKFTPEFKRNYQILKEERNSLYQELKSITFKYNNGDLDFETCNKLYFNILKKEQELKKEYSNNGVSYKYIYDYWEEKRKRVDGDVRIDQRLKLFEQLKVEKIDKLEQVIGRRFYYWEANEAFKSIFGEFHEKYCSIIIHDDYDVYILSKNMDVNRLRYLVDAKKNGNQDKLIWDTDLIKLF